MTNKVAIILPTYNRPEYLNKSLGSLQKTFIEKNTLLYFIDDASTDPETIKQINDFKKDGCVLKHVFKKKNLGVSDSLVTVLEDCFVMGYEYVIILNTDMIVNNYFYDIMTYYKNIFPNNIISGFNTLTPGENGKPRHPIVYDGKFYIKKKTSGAPCLGLDKNLYNKFFKDIITEYGRKRKSAFDTAVTRKASNEGCDIICTVPSVAQHIGMDSSMRHSFNPDEAVDFKPYVRLNKFYDRND